MNEQLIIRNFGPIKKATVDFKRVTVFIGPTGGGKSTLAKLAAVFRDKQWPRKQDAEQKKLAFDELLNGFLILDYLKNDGEIKWLSEIDNAAYDEEGLHHDISKRKELFIAGKETFDRIASQLFIPEVSFVLERATDEERVVMEAMNGSVTEVYYVPADRAFAAALESGLAGLVLEGIALPETLLAFLNEFKVAHNNLSLLPLDVSFLSISYRMVEKQARVDLGEDGIIELARGASGIQAVVPMMLIINYHVKRHNKQTVPLSFIVEEPEINLYPTAQQGLLNWLVEKCTEGENDLTITTHSPYILSSCNLLLEAYKVAQQRPELADEIDKIVPRACWLNPAEFAAYYVADGTVKPITDERTHLIGGNELDAVSGDISDSFRRLLQLKKQVA